MQQKRDNVVQFWSLIPSGMTAKQYRDQVKAVAALRGISVQQLVQSGILSQLERKESK